MCELCRHLEKQIHEKSEIEIVMLGEESDKLRDLDRITKETLTKADKKSRIYYVTDLYEIARYGVTETPALVINEIMISSGKIPTEEEILQALNGNL